MDSVRKCVYSIKHWIIVEGVCMLGGEALNRGKLTHDILEERGLSKNKFGVK
jgi:hypothetical protein